MRIIVAGSRTFNDYALLEEKVDTFISIHREEIQSDIEIVSGGARGADSLAIKYAEKKGYPCRKFLAYWEELGKSAGYIRNVKMADYADALIAFWDGKSKGTKHMIKIAKRKGLVCLTVFTNVERVRVK